MRTLRGLLVLAAIAAIAVAWASTQEEADPPRSAQPTAAPEGALKLTFAYSKNLGMMKTLLPEFNARRFEVGGRPVFVEGIPGLSGDIQAKIIAGKLKPHAYSPASSLWGRLLNYEADRAYVPDESPSLASSPVVIAMWEPLARALGWPDRAIGFADILELATTKSDWAQFGKPTFGKFKLGHTNPDFSTSGLSFVSAQYYTAAGKREGLTIEDVRRPEIRAKVRAIEQSIVHYGDSGSFFSEQLDANGPGYASAVAMEETTLIDFNQARGPDEMKLVAIYPAEGTYMSDNRYMLLDAPWVTPAHRTAGQELGRWLQEKLTPELLAKYSYRSGKPGAAPLPPVTMANGALPHEPKRLLSLPEPKVLAEIKRAWHEDRKPANVLLVVDVSGSMKDEDKIGQARRGLLTFLDQLSPADRVGLMTFSGSTQMVQPVATFADNGAALRSHVSELFADGDTALYDGTIAGWNTVDALNDDTRINAVVLLSDGADTASNTTLSSVTAKLGSRANGEGRQIRVFTIAYGKDATTDVLEQIAAASGGKAYSGDPETIGEVYLQISSYF